MKTVILLTEMELNIEARHRKLAFWWTAHVQLYFNFDQCMAFRCLRIGEQRGSGESAHKRRLARVFAAPMLGVGMAFK